MPEERLHAGEESPTDHDHSAIAITDEALRDHLAFDHMTVGLEGLSFTTLQGMHDRFHGRTHATDE